MRIRTFASCVALLLIAWTFTPVEATARGGFRAGAPFALKFGGHRFHGAGRFRAAQRFGRLPYVAVVSGGGIAAPDNSVLWVGLSNPPLRPPEPPTQRVCFAQLHTVPSEAGGVRDIRVTRCFQEALPLR